MKKDELKQAFGGLEPTEELTKEVWTRVEENMETVKKRKVSKIDSEVKTVEVGEKSVTIKKEAEDCYLAVWTDGDYSYSVSVQTPFSQEELTGLVEQVQ